MTFIEALQYAISRKVVLPAEYYQVMIDQQRKSAVSISGLAQLEQINFIVGEVNKAIENGDTFKDFLAKVRKGGVDDLLLPDYRMDNIFRTNIQTAYNHGRWQQQWSNRDDRPYLMYDAVNDSRTRPHHKALDGIIKPIDDVFWEANYTPNGFRCRCNIKALTEQQALKLGGVTVDIPANAKPDAGWATSPKTHNKTLQGLVEQYQPKKIVVSNKVREALEGGKERVLAQTRAVNDKDIFDRIKKIPPNNIALRYFNRSTKVQHNIKESSLSLAEGFSIFGYTRGSQHINLYLQGEEKLTGTVKAIMDDNIALILTGMAKIPNYEGIVIRRSPLYDDLQNLKKGDLFSSSGFMSAGINNDEAGKDVFSSLPVRLIIQSKTGKRIEDFSIKPKQKEVLIYPNTMFIVDDVEQKDNGELWITMIEK